MNWRGRPLTSHDVIVNSLVATTTRTGLTVHAELDPGTCNTGIKVTASDIDTLPMHRHRFHGDWNHTLHPRPRDTTSADTTPRLVGGPSPQPCTGCLRNPELTGVPEPALDELIGQLAQKFDGLCEQGRLRQRGGQRIRARGAGAKDKLTTADRVLATVLYLRKLGTLDLLAQCRRVSPSGSAGSGTSDARELAGGSEASERLPPASSWQAEPGRGRRATPTARTRA